MSPDPAPKPSGWAALWAVLERGTLSLLSISIGLVDLLIALFVAAHLGVIPKKTLDTAMSGVRGLPVVGPWLANPAKPAKSAKRPPARR